MAAGTMLLKSYSLCLIIVTLNIGPYKVLTPTFAKCIWYGECGADTRNDKMLNCPYDGDPKPATANILEVLNTWCPHYFEEGMPNETCCDTIQIESFERNIALVSTFLSRCPSCQVNFLAPICHLTCSPYQSSFMRVDKTQATKEGKTGVSEITTYLSKTYAIKMLSSCLGIKGPEGVAVMDILCNRPSIACSPEVLFKHMGDVNAYSFFQINFILTDDSSGKYTPLSIKTYGCEESPGENLSACTCQDCKASCPAAAEYKKPTKLCVGKILLSQFILLLIFLLAMAGLIPLLVYYYRWEQANSKVPETGKKLDCLSLFFSKVRNRTKTLEELGVQMEQKLEHGYGYLGRRCASRPWAFLAGGVISFVLLSIGIIFIKLTTKPSELWASPNSRARLDKEYFDEHFGPFYRTEQIILKPVEMANIFYNTSGSMIEFGPIFNKVFLLTAYELQKSIEKISANGYTLKDLCFAPLSNSYIATDVSQCLIFSIWGFYQDNTFVLEEDYLDHAINCISNPIQIDCLAKWGGPILPETTLGGFLSAPRNDLGLPRPERADALIITYLLRNNLEEEKQIPAREWEAEFIHFLKNWKLENETVHMQISFASESSIEKELERSSQADACIIAISYITMFIYIILFLGRYSKSKRWLIEGKISLGLFGLITVLMSVSSSIGFFGYCGVPVTPIIIEVIPFLVLAIGVDNIFIMVQAYDRLNEIPGETVIERTGRMLGFVGPSVTLTSISECCAFFIGALSTMPAVQAFALYAGMALLIDFLFQITCFVSLIALDSARLRANRYDVICCVKSHVPKEEDHSFILSCFKKYFVPAVMHRYARPAIIVFFTTLSFVSVFLFHGIKIGLSPKLSMTKDSYMYEFIEDLNRYLSIGPPIFFVVKESDLNYSDYKIQNLFCASPNCDSDSLALQVFGATNSELSYIAKPVYSWLDDFFTWSKQSECCKYWPNKTFCPHTDPSCEECPKEPLQQDRPAHNDFEKYITFFLKDDPDGTCTKSGHPKYAAGVNIRHLGVDEMGFEKSAIGANYFMTFHTILNTSEDFYRALESAYKISDNITRTINNKISQMGINTKVEIFPYSVFYVFYEQYLTLWEDSLKGILISFLAIFIATFLLLGLDIWSACLVVLTICMIIINLLGMMYIWGIELNAISLVNIVLAIGISVEFCSHITHSFIMNIGPDRIKRASLSLVEMGSSVFAGITITKLIGISVLAFASSQIFQIFYFKMFFSIVFVGAGHGLIFHPVLLSYLGSQTHSYFTRKFMAQGTLNINTNESKPDTPDDNKANISGDDENIKVNDDGASTNKK